MAWVSVWNSGNVYVLRVGSAAPVTRWPSSHPALISYLWFWYHVTCSFYCDCGWCSQAAAAGVVSVTRPIAHLWVAVAARCCRFIALSAGWTLLFLSPFWMESFSVAFLLSCCVGKFSCSSIVVRVWFWILSFNFVNILACLYCELFVYILLLS